MVVFILSAITGLMLCVLLRSRKARRYLKFLADQKKPLKTLFRVTKYGAPILLLLGRPQPLCSCFWA